MLIVLMTHKMAPRSLYEDSRNSRTLYFIFMVSTYADEQLSPRNQHSQVLNVTPS